MQQYFSRANLNSVFYRIRDIGGILIFYPQCLSAARRIHRDGFPQQGLQALWPSSAPLDTDRAPLGQPRECTQLYTHLLCHHQLWHPARLHSDIPRQPQPCCGANTPHGFQLCEAGRGPQQEQQTFLATSTGRFLNSRLLQKKIFSMSSCRDTTWERQSFILNVSFFSSGPSLTKRLSLGWEPSFSTHLPLAPWGTATKCDTHIQFLWSNVSCQRCDLGLAHGEVPLDTLCLSSQGPATNFNAESLRHKGGKETPPAFSFGLAGWLGSLSSASANNISNAA